MKFQTQPVKVVFESSELVGIARMQDEPLEYAQTRFIRSRLSQAGVPIKHTFGGQKIEVTHGILHQKRMSMTEDLIFLWKPD